MGKTQSNPKPKPPSPSRPSPKTGSPNNSGSRPKKQQKDKIAIQ